MTQEFCFNSTIKNRYENLDKNELLHNIQKFEFSEISYKLEIKNLQSRLNKFETLLAAITQRHFDIEENLKAQISQMNADTFGKSSEKSTDEEIKKSNHADGTESKPSPKNPHKKAKEKRVLLPSERYPNAEVKIIEVTLDKPPHCPCCSEVMSDSGMTEDSERLTVIPKKYVISKHRRHKYRCGKCQGAIVTAPAIPAITPGSSLSDAMAIDVSVSKFCDLVPMTRYAKIAERAGISGLPHQSLIESTHALSLFVRKVYRMLRDEILVSRVLHADETPHRMLEGDEKSHWYLWGFTNKIAAYFDIRDTRSGDVASVLLKQSLCEYLMSDVFSGYAKAVREINEARIAENKPKIVNIYCNAHARRKFKKLDERFKDEAEFFLDHYRKIYALESQIADLKNQVPDTPYEKLLEIRKKMRPHFEEMKNRVLLKMLEYSEKSELFKGMRYFLNNYDDLTRFLEDIELPIDNNLQERLLRNPVIGRKTWYGTHSKQGAETTAVLFSIMESCKLNKVNPRAYLAHLITALHLGRPAFTPHTYATTPALRQDG